MCPCGRLVRGCGSEAPVNSCEEQLQLGGLLLMFLFEVVELARQFARSCLRTCLPNGIVCRDELITHAVRCAVVENGIGSTETKKASAFSGPASLM